MSENLSAKLTPQPPLPLRAPNEASALEEVTERADTVWTRPSGPPPKVATTERRDLRGKRGRVAIVDGCRTPFMKSGTDFANMDVTDLASTAAAELVARTGIDPEIIDLSVFGVVVPALHAPNLGREVVFRTSLPMRIPGVTLNLACASSTRALTFGAGAILSGECDVVLAGGAESLSNVPIQFSRKAANTFMELSKAKTLPQKAGALEQAAAGGPRPGGAGDRRVHDRPDHGPVGGEDGEGERHLAPRPGRDRPDVAPAGRRGDRGRPADGADRASLPAAALRQGGHAGQRHPRRHLAGSAGEAEAGLRPPLRHPHRRQLEPADRRRLGRAADERGEGEGAGLHAARLYPLLRLHRARTPATSSCRGRPTPRRWRWTPPASSCRTSTWSRCTRPSRRRSSRT